MQKVLYFISKSCAVEKEVIQCLDTQITITNRIKCVQEGMFKQMLPSMTKINVETSEKNDSF